METLNTINFDKFLNNLNKLNLGLENLNTSVKKVEGTLGTGDPVLPPLRLNESRKSIYTRDPEPKNTYGNKNSNDMWFLFQGLKALPEFGKMLSWGEVGIKAYDYSQKKENKLIQDPYNIFESYPKLGLAWGGVKWLTGQIPNQKIKYPALMLENGLEYFAREERRKLLEINSRHYLRPINPGQEIMGDVLGNTVDALKQFLKEHNIYKDIDFGKNIFEPLGKLKLNDVIKESEQKSDKTKVKKNENIKTFEEQEKEQKELDERRLPGNFWSKPRFPFHPAEQDNTYVKTNFPGGAGFNTKGSNNSGNSAYHNSNRQRAGAGSRSKEEDPVETMTGVFGEVQKVGGAMSTLMQTLNIGADTFVGGIVNGFNSALTIIQTMIAVMQAVNTIKMFLPFATGGSVPGIGDTDSVPAMLTPGEYVVKKSVVNKFGSGFFEWINGGGLTNSLAGHYAGGGMVAAAGRQMVAVTIPDVKLKGSDLYLSWRREINTHGRRSI